MKSKKKLIIILSAVGGAVLIALAIVLAVTLGGKPVDVYPVSQLGLGWYSDDSDKSSGIVRSEGVQNVMLSDTQNIQEFYVSKGDQVKVGDALFSYDSTLSDLDIEKARIEVQKKELSLQKARKELARINALVPGSDELIQPDNSWIHYNPEMQPVLMGDGDGTEDNPLFWLIPTTAKIYSNDFFETIVPEEAEEVYVVLLLRDENAVNGPIMDYIGLHIFVNEESDPAERTDNTNVKDNGPEPEKREFSFRLYTPEIPEDIAEADIPEDPYYEHHGSDYSEADIARMRQEEEAKIKELEIQIKVKALEYEKKKSEISDNVIRAKQNGTVKAVRTQEEAIKTGKPVVEISSGGGFYVDASVGELKLAGVHAGDKVSVTSMTTGETAEGTISEISTIPMEGGNNYASGNTNISYYPATIFIPDTAVLAEGDYVDVSFSSDAARTDSIYIMSMFILQDKDGSCIYVRDENGKLKKRTVRTGKDMYGSYTEIKEGLSNDEWVAFPYGKNLKEGAKTQEGSLDSLYGY